MAQRLVDVVDNDDAEHNGLGIEMETSVPMTQSLPMFTRPPLELIYDSSIGGFRCGGVEIPIQLMSPRPSQRTQMDFLGSTNLTKELDVRQGSGSHMRPQATSLEDLALIDTVPGI